MKAFIVIGLGFGDEGKGSVVDWLTREYDSALTVRFNGGAQAAHHVVTPEGIEHTFHMYGSGTLAGASTYLTQDVLVNPLVLATEAAELMDQGIRDPFPRMWIHQACPITTPYHVALNRLKEISRGDARHGSCGLGIGETMEDVLKGDSMHWWDLYSRDRVDESLQAIREDKLQQANKLPHKTTMAWEKEIRVLYGDEDRDILETFQIVAGSVNTIDRMPKLGTIIFEGAQGVLIDQDYGTPPYHTWSDCTPMNAMEELDRNWLYGADTTILGVTRAYLTRHGAGPFPSEGLDLVTPDQTNHDNPWQGKLRYGYPDRVLLRYAANACRHSGGLDGLVVTCLDQLHQRMVPVADSPHDDPWRDSRSCHRVNRERLPHSLAKSAGVPLFAISRGPKSTDKYLEKALTINS